MPSHYIGQEVLLNCGITGHITRIEKSYVIIEGSDGREYVGTASSYNVLRE